MTFLLDVNILYILHQPRHADYKVVHRWFTGKSGSRFATCAITQSGMLRLLTQGIGGLDRFPIGDARSALQGLIQNPHHVFWSDAPPYLEITAPLARRMQGYRQTTDAYLLGLAKYHGGKLATMDKAVDSLAGPEHSEIVELVG